MLLLLQAERKGRMLTADPQTLNAARTCGDQQAVEHLQLALTMGRDVWEADTAYELTGRSNVIADGQLDRAGWSVDKSPASAARLSVPSC